MAIVAKWQQAQPNCGLRAKAMFLGGVLDVVVKRDWGA